MYGVGWLTAIKESQGEFFYFKSFAVDEEQNFLAIIHTR